MKKQFAEQASASGAPEVSYAPKRYSSGEQAVFALKFGGVVALLVLILWLMDKHI